MTLEDYLKSENLSAAEFGRRIGVNSRMTVIRYLTGERIPRPKVMSRIHEVTGGAVTPNDFFSQDGEAA